MSESATAQWLIEHYGMKILPVESTLLTSTYASAALTASGGPLGTAMIGLYCQEPLSRSLFHRLDHDEVWHFYSGDPLRLVLLHPDGRTEEVILGPDIAAGQRVQHVIPSGVWQAGETVPGGSWTLFGCTMAPGFTPECFEGGYAHMLSDQYPDRASDIARLGVPADSATTIPTNTEQEQ